MIKIDSREVLKGDTFIAIRGINNDGHKYVQDAIKRGATKVIVEEGNYDTLMEKKGLFFELVKRQQI